MICGHALFLCRFEGDLYGAHLMWSIFAYFRLKESRCLFVKGVFFSLRVNYVLPGNDDILTPTEI